MNEEISKQIYEWLLAHDDYLIVSHINPDGDATGSLLAMAQVIQRLNKKGTLINEGSTPSRFSYLPSFDKIINLSTTSLNRTFKYVICVDCADYGRMGKVSEYLTSDAEVINIDHHPTNDQYGHIALVNPKACSTCEVIFDFLRVNNIDLCISLATCLYTGYLTDTGGFRYSNTTPKVLRDAADLVAAGVQPYEVAEKALESVSYEHVQLLSKSLSQIELKYDRKVAILSLPLTLLQETGATKEDAEGLVNYGRNIEGVEVAVLIRETEHGVKVSFRSKDYVDVSLIAKQLGGGGHVRAAGCSMLATIEEARMKIEPLIQKALLEGNQ